MRSNGEALTEVLGWVGKTVLLPLVAPIVVSAALVYLLEPLLAPKGPTPGLSAWGRVFTAPEVLFIGVIAGILTMIRYAQCEVSPQVTWQKWGLASVALVCSALLLTTATAYGLFIAFRVLEIQFEAATNPSPSWVVLTVLCLILASAVVRFWILKLEPKPASS